jgi:hypothetical protein
MQWLQDNAFNAWAGKCIDFKKHRLFDTRKFQKLQARHLDNV